MNFRCKNCGGSMVFSPELQKMQCPYCDGINCEETVGDDSLTICAACGGEVEINEFTSASKCPYCGNNIVFDKRVENEYKPDRIIPFKIGKDAAVEAIDNEFKKRTFAPVSFLSEKSLENMQGRYVPFFLYDYTTISEYKGTGTKVRTWRQGDYDYTETSYYDVERKIRAKFNDIPADASTEMHDGTMDLMEPYDYELFTSFDPKYMSGFYGEIYNDEPQAYKKRAEKKALDSARTLLGNSLADYQTLTPSVNETIAKETNTDYALFPVWVYKFKWAGKDYPVFVNGQSGKVVGKTPVSKLKVFLYGLTAAGLTYGIAYMIALLVEVM